MKQSRSSFVARVRKECNVMVRRFSNARIVGENQILEGQYVYVKDSVIAAVTQEE
jgi:hypothetical protein